MHIFMKNNSKQTFTSNFFFHNGKSVWLDSQAENSVILVNDFSLKLKPLNFDCQQC